MGAGQLGQEAENRALTVRAFFALPVPDGHREALDAYIIRCASRAPAFRWTPTANMHLTIRFLGQVEGPVADAVADAVEAAAPGRFEVALGQVGTFGRGRMARVVWIGLRSGEAEASELAALVEAECARAGLEPEIRRFHAHLTLARARPREGAVLPALPDPPELGPWHADGLVLYRSRLGRGGSVYEPLRTISLR